MRKVLKLSHTHPTLVILLTCALTLFFLVFAFRITIDPSIDNLLPKQNEMYELMDKYESDISTSAKMFIAFESRNPFTIDGLRSLYSTIEEIEQLSSVTNSLHPFNAVTFSYQAGRLKVAPIAPDRRYPENNKELQRFRRNLVDDPFYKNKLISKDGTIIGAIFYTKTVVDDSRAFSKEVHRILDTAAGRHYNVYASGDLLLQAETTKYITKDLTKLLIFSLVFMLLFFFFGFRSRRSIFLPISIVIIGTTWTIGFMSVLGFSLTIISVATPPLVLTIGSSYTIHLLSQFYRESPRKAPIDSLWILDATLHVNKTILVSALTTVIGFMSLLATSLDQTKELGIATSFGIISCMLLSLFFLPALLSLLSPPSNWQAKRMAFGPLSRKMRKLGFVVYRNYMLFLVMFFALIGTFFISLGYITHQSDAVTYFPDNNPLIQDSSYIFNNIGGFQKVNVTFNAPEGSEKYFLQPENLKPVSQLEKEVLNHKYISSSISFPLFVRELNKMFNDEEKIPEKRGLLLMTSRYINLIRSKGGDTNLLSLVSNEEFSRITLTFYMYNRETNTFISRLEIRDLINMIRDKLVHIEKTKVEAEIWSYDLRYMHISELLNKEQRRVTFISIVLVGLFTSLVFMSLRYGLLSLVPIITGLMINFTVMAIFQIPLDVITMMVSSVAIGVGIDDGIHFLLQYRRLNKMYPNNHRRVITDTFRITGRPIFHTTVSVVGGLIVLVFASFKGIAYFGLLVAITLTAALIGTLFFLPSILILFNKKREKSGRQ